MYVWLNGTIFILAFSTVAFCRVMADISQEYMVLGWSPEETKILALRHKHEPEIMEEKVQLVEYDLATGMEEVLVTHKDIKENIRLYSPLILKAKLKNMLITVLNQAAELKNLFNCRVI